MKRMLFNATQQEELRVAIVDGQKLIDIDIETAGRELRKSNIYKGVITRIEPSLEACFVNYGEDRHGFLPFKEVARSYFKEGADVRNASIKEALREGQEIMVQIEKEERGNKGAALTSFVSLAGRYLVLMPNNPRGGGVSRRVEGEDRQELREAMDKLDLPSGMSVIARTAGIGRNVDELQWDLNYLMQLWSAIEGASKSASGAFLIYQESSLVIRAIRDYFQPDIGEILIDTDDIYEQAQQFMSHVMPDMVHRVKRYSDDVPLFSRFQIEHQIETAYSRTVPLPSGGAIVIDHTEALVSVDVNSARATRGSDIETTAFNTNCEAAEEVARQLRLRDLGGLIVIDFIDMESAKNQREVETRLKDALRYDRARVQMGKISRFGLMELSRQRLRPSLSEGSHVTCPRCNGTGHIRDTESSALQILRIIQEEAMKENSAAIHVQVPVDVAAFLLNEKRGEILKIETRHRVTIILIPNKNLETPHYKLDRIKADDPRLEEAHASYAMAEQGDTDIGYSKGSKNDVKPRQEAMVKSITPDTAPIVDRKAVRADFLTPPAETGFFARLMSWLFGTTTTKEVPPITSNVKIATGSRNGGNDRNHRNRNRNNRNRRDNEERSTAPQAASPASSSSNMGNASTSNKQAKPAITDSATSNDAARSNKSARPPKQERESPEARRERQQREREERAAKRAANEAQTQAPAQGVSAVATGSVTPTVVAELKDPAPLIEKANLPVGEENQEVGDDEPRRRRRRRGGRNRNRREREAGESTVVDGATHDNADEFVPVADMEQAQQQASLSSHETAKNNDAHFEKSALTSESSAVIADAHPKNAEQTIAVSVATETVQMETVAVTIETPAMPLQTNSHSEVAMNDAVISKTTAAVQEPLRTEPATQPTLQPMPPAAIPTQVELKFESTPDSVIDTTTEVAVKEVSNSPVAPVVTAAAVIAPSPAVKVEDLKDMLQSAGLVLAGTDPEKLRNAQMQATPIAEVRKPRVRKPPVQVSNEPLELVQTKK